MIDNMEQRPLILMTGSADVSQRGLRRMHYYKNYPEAWDQSGRLVEAFSHETLPIWAAQWHPERMTGRERITPEGPDMASLFQFLCEECRSKKRRGNRKL